MSPARTYDGDVRMRGVTATAQDAVVIVKGTFPDTHEWLIRLVAVTMVSHGRLVRSILEERRGESCGVRDTEEGEVEGRARAGARSGADRIKGRRVQAAGHVRNELIIGEV